MLLPAVILVVAAILLVVVHVVFQNRLRAAEAQVQEEVEADKARIVLGDADCDRDLADRLLSGEGLDASLDAYQEKRAGLLVLEQTGRTWAWDQADLERWAAKRLRQGCGAARRRLVVPWVLLYAVVVVATVLAVFLIQRFDGRRGGRVVSAAAVASRVHTC